MKNKTLNNISNLNREILYLGLKPEYWLGLIFIFFLSFLVLKVYTLLLILPIMFVLLNLEKKAKKGNPDFLKSNTNFKRIPKSIIDPNSIIKHL